MNLWSIFITGLFAGGASCAAVQGGLLVASVMRRTGQQQIDVTTVPKRHPVRAARGTDSKSRERRRRQQRAIAERAALARRLVTVAPRRPMSTDDVIPVAGFLGGKLASHTLLGALLGAFGASFQLGFRTRAIMQFAAGALMLLMAANLLGVPGLKFLVPSPPLRLTKLVRRTAHSETVFAPALLGLSTVLIPCGVTLSVMFLAVASKSAPWGAAAMATFVIGTSPLFATIGLVLQRSATTMRATVTKLAAAAIVAAGLFAINGGLVLEGASFTLSDAYQTIVGGDGKPVPAAVDQDGVQQIVINARNGSYSPSNITAHSGVASRLTLKTNGTSGCTRSFVIPSLGIEKNLPTTGETTIDLGVLKPGTIRFTCAMGMYRGRIDVT